MTAKLTITVRFIDGTFATRPVDAWDIPNGIAIVLSLVKKEGRIPVYFYFSRRILTRENEENSSMTIYSSPNYYISINDDDQLFHLRKEIEDAWEKREKNQPSEKVEY